MKKQMSVQVLTFAALAVVLNIVGNYIVVLTKVPLLFLDTIGTIFAAVLFGPWVGGMVGVVTNLVNGILTGPTAIPFLLVSLAIGVIVGLIAQKWKFNLLTALLTGLLLSIVAPLIGTPIVVAVYGGLTGSGTDLIVLWLMKSGQRIFAATFLSRITGNLVDKIASCLLVWVMVKAMPISLINRFKQNHAA